MICCYDRVWKHKEHVRPCGLIDITIALRVAIETLQVQAVERDMEIASILPMVFPRSLVVRIN